MGGRAGDVSGDVRLTYSDRSISNWGTQEPTSQTREEPKAAGKATTRGSNTGHMDGHRMTRRGYKEEKQGENMEATAQQCLHLWH